MKKYIQSKCTKLAGIVCNCCGCKVYGANSSEFSNAFIYDDVGGYGSKFGDGVKYSVELCDACWFKIIKPYIKIEEMQNGRVADCGVVPGDIAEDVPVRRGQDVPAVDVLVGGADHGIPGVLRPEVDNAHDADVAANHVGDQGQSGEGGVQQEEIKFPCRCRIKTGTRVGVDHWNRVWPTEFSDYGDIEPDQNTVFDCVDAGQSIKCTAKGFGLLGGSGEDYGVGSLYVQREDLVKV